MENLRIFVNVKHPICRTGWHIACYSLMSCDMPLGITIWSQMKLNTLQVLITWLHLLTLIIFFTIVCLNYAKNLGSVGRLTLRTVETISLSRHSVHSSIIALHEQIVTYIVVVVRLRQYKFCLVMKVLKLPIENPKWSWWRTITKKFEIARYVPRWRNLPIWLPIFCTGRIHYGTCSFVVTVTFNKYVLMKYL